jgi:hypothetical protein
MFKPNPHHIPILHAFPTPDSLNDHEFSARSAILAAWEFCRNEHMDHKYDANGPPKYFYGYDQRSSRTTHRLQSRSLLHLFSRLDARQLLEILEAVVVS